MKKETKVALSELQKIGVVKVKNAVMVVHSRSKRHETNAKGDRKQMQLLFVNFLGHEGCCASPKYLFFGAIMLDQKTNFGTVKTGSDYCSA